MEQMYNLLLWDIVLNVKNLLNVLFHKFVLNVMEQEQ